MADDSNALLAMLLQGQRKRTSPYDRMATFGQSLQQTGSSTAPVQSPLEGLARALQAGIGGAMSGFADIKTKEREVETNESLADFLQADTPEKKQAAYARMKNADPDIAASLYTQLITQKMADDRAIAAGQRAYGSTPTIGGPAVSGTGQPVPGQPQTPSTAPLPAGTVPGDATGFANNIGNIRVSGSPFAGKGQPYNGFETFATPQAGANAAVANLGAYAKANPNITVAQAIAKWAPPSENNTQAYITQMAEATGINPGIPLAELLADPAQTARFLEGMTQKEKGGMPPGVTPDVLMTAGGQQPQIPLAAGSASAPPGTQTQVTQAPATTTIPEFSPEALELQRQARAAAASGTPTGLAQAKQLQDQAVILQGKWKQDRELDRIKRGQDLTEKIAAEQRASAADTQKAMNQPAQAEVDKVRVIRAEGATLVDALAKYETEMLKGVGFRDLTGVATPANTAYMQAALLAKGEALYKLGVLSGPDMDVLRKSFPDPSTLKGAAAKPEEVRNAVKGITDLITNRIAQYEKQLGMAPSAQTAPQPQPSPSPQATPSAPNVGDVMQGHRFKGGDPSRPENWEKL